MDRDRLPLMKVLFLCTGNSCRSQMAEAWTRKLHPDRFEPYSAGTKPGQLDSRAVRVMTESGIAFDYVITVSDDANESCPVFPGNVKQIHSAFDDPPRLAAGATSDEVALAPYRRDRDDIERRVLEWLGDPDSAGHWVAPRQRVSTDREESS